MADGYLNFDTKVDTEGFKKGTKSLEKTFSKLGAKIAAVFSVTALTLFSKKAIETASDMQEVQNVVNTAFGDMAYKMEEFANSAIELYGISKLTAKRTGSTFASMGNGMGLTSDAATDMAVALTALSADMASFYNVSQDVAATALKSVFTGETETLKQFGVVMTEANLEAFALSQGITKSYQAMTQAEKVQLRYGYVMKTTALAQGDFAKTSGGWANQTRILSEKFKEFYSIIGNSLMNIVLPAVKALNSAMTTLINYTQTAAKAIAEFMGWELTSAQNVAESTKQTVSNYEDMANGAEATAEANERSLAGFDKINKLSDSGDSSASAGAGAITTAPSTGNMTSTVTIDADTSKITSKLQKLKDLLQPIGEEIGTGLKWFYDNVLKPVGNWVGNGLAPAFINFLKDAIDGLSAAWKTASPVIYDKLWLGFLKPIASFTAGAAITALEMLGGAIKFIGESITAEEVSLLTTILTTLVEIFVASKIIAGIQLMVEKFIALKTLLSTLGTTLSGTVTASFGTLGVAIATAIAAWNIGTWLYETFEEEFNAFLYPIFDLFVSGWNMISDFFTKTVPTFFRNLWTNIKNIFSTCVAWWKTLFTNAWNGIRTAWSGVKTWFSNLWAGIKNVFSNVGTWFKNIFTNAWNGIKSAWSSVSTFFQGVLVKIASPFSNIANWFKNTFTKAWNNVKAVFSAGGKIFDGIKDGILNGLKTVINALIGGINKVIKLPFDGINKALKKIKKVEILGLTPFDWIKTIDVPQIPKLAGGTVIPPNKEFLAILGDQTHGTNVEAPLSTIKQALAEVLAGKNLGGNSIQTIEIPLYLSGIELFREIVRLNKQNTIVTGRNALA
ncbi:MAG: hypothetical protein IJ031_07785 [Oscillospiraceae bacterium]|nr:hypothetical protein [Oscillospiraceae bacterium]MBQ8378498.1 hypothetical protein [Oscillospiraceae bacterium]MBQ8884469.1 hypothetical protein [Oscillospiraceae bacterium]